VKLVSLPAAHVGLPGGHEVRDGVAGPQEVPFAQAGVKVVNTGPEALVVHVSGESAQLVGAFAALPHPVAALHVGVKLVSLPTAHVGLPGGQGLVDSVDPQAGEAPPLQVATSPK
jgi:hypothetical protein